MEVVVLCDVLQAETELFTDGEILVFTDHWEEHDVAGDWGGFEVRLRCEGASDGDATDLVGLGAGQGFEPGIEGSALIVRVGGDNHCDEVAFLWEVGRGPNLGDGVGCGSP